MVLTFKTVCDKRNKKIKVKPRINMPTEAKLNNEIDKDLQSVLKPLNLIQGLFIMAKYKISDNRIQKDTLLYNLLSIICLIIYRLVNFYKITISSLNRDWEGTRFFIYMSNINDTIFYTFGFVLNNCINIFYSDSNILLVLKLQQVHRILKINSKHLNDLISFYWRFIISFFISHLLFEMYFIFQFPVYTMYGVLLSFAILTTDINIIYAYFLMKLLNKTLRVWIEEIQKLRNFVTFSINDSYWIEMFNAFEYILKVYNFIRKVFKLMVSYCFIIIMTETFIIIVLYSFFTFTIVEIMSFPCHF
ncbi:hypothetical protein B5X24_HaOG200702 [Helicoverpa armigera]|uniref:Gustatory receptor n=1 Tax=Helicoverpa armigera TaxID=29058 RepID=A0A2W1BZ38_HELAM|nr:hypothetical protein B5X24_HaOG200702 [Helicoverpa armigera]